MTASVPRLATTWDGLTATEISRRTGVPRVLLFDEVESTQDIALDEGAESAAPTLVLANRQRAGRGRLGRSWRSDAGQGVWSTLTASADLDAKAADVLTVRIGLFLARELDALARERVGLKWPNDLLTAAGKVAGILVERRIWTTRSTAYVIGVGVNVVPPPDIDGAAALPAGTRRVDVLEAIARSVRGAAMAEGHLTPAELKDYSARDRLFGQRLTSPGRGIARGIADTGCLMIEASAGMEYHRSGTVQLAEDT